MTAIQGIEVIHVSLPTRREHKWTGLTEPIGGYVLIRMTGDDGLVGWGEAPALKDWGGDYGRYFGETPGTTRHVVERYLAPAVAGCEAANIVELHARMDAVIKGYPYAKAALDMAAYDLAGRALGVPVHTLLGGRLRETVAITWASLVRSTAGLPRTPSRSFAPLSRSSMPRAWSSVTGAR